MDAWAGILIGGLLGGGGLGAVLVFVATRKRDSQAGIAERFDDASELAKYIDARVEEKVKPIREQLASVESEAREIRASFRAWILAVWSWNTRGRSGDLPMPPQKILLHLGLEHFADEWPTEPPRTRPPV